MSSVALAPSIVRTPTLARDVAIVAAGVALISLCAQIVVPLPFTPVPITGQTLGALLVGGAAGFARGGIAFAVYMLVGALGAPVFADGSSGFAVFTSVTGGYLVGMLVAAAFVGWAAERGWDRRVIPALASMIAGNAIVYLIGATWLGISLNIDVATTLDLGVTPFLIGDAIKIGLAACALPAAWALVDRIRSAA